MIDKLFLLYKKATAYEADVNQNKIKPTSVAFVVDDHTIRTQGYTFGDKLPDLSQYVKNTDLNNYVRKDEINQYITDDPSSSIPDGPGGDIDLSEYVRKDELDLSPYARKDEIDLSLYAKKDEINLSEYIRKDEVQNYIQQPAVSDDKKHVFLTQSQYDSILEYENNTIYFILESVNTGTYGSKFGDTFPFRFGWAFGNEFPVILN